MGWPVVALGEVVRHRKEFVTIEPDKTYSRCRVQTSARGIVLRDRVPGDTIKGISNNTHLPHGLESLKHVNQQGRRS